VIGTNSKMHPLKRFSKNWLGHKNAIKIKLKNMRLPIFSHNPPEN
jgi:hypothetical protein